MSFIGIGGKKLAKSRTSFLVYPDYTRYMEKD